MNQNIKTNLITNDPTTRRMLEDILKDEEDHADDLSDLIKIKKTE